MRSHVSQYYKGLSLISAAILLAGFQLIKFDKVIAHTSGWTDGQAESWTVFSPIIDASIMIVIILLVLSGTYLCLKETKKQWFRIVLPILVSIVAWIVFYVMQLTIQQHLSHFKGL